jgi:hypothetical protein
LDKQRWSLMLLSLALIMVIGACSNAGVTDNSPTAASSEPLQTEATNSSNHNTETDAPVSSPTNAEPAESVDHDMPEYLPQDFPLPQDAEISTSHSSETDGKKAVLLIFSTKESMATVTKLYKDYFNGLKLENAAQTIDDKNIIIQGEDAVNHHGWSMLGGLLAGQDGVVQLTVTWAEL